MINIDSKILEIFINQNGDFLTGARVQKIQQPTRREVILHLRKNAESKKLYININPAFAHLCFMSSENERRRNFTMQQHPPMFCMLLRKHMEGAKITCVKKPENERIVELFFKNHNELGDEIEECLSVELMGKHSNIVLYNTDNNIILGCAHNIGAEKSKERELAGGLPYIYPPRQNKKNLLTTRYATFEKIIAQEAGNKQLKNIVNEKFLAIAQVTVEEICKRDSILATDKEGIQKLYIALHEYLEEKNPVYTMAEDRSVYSPILPYELKYDGVNELIDDYYSYHLEIYAIRTLAAELSAVVKKELKRLKNSLKNQNLQIEKAKKADVYKLKADLIMSNLYNLKNFSSKIYLEDFTTAQEIEIEMDEQLSAVENANRYYKLYNKTKRACDYALALKKETENELLYYEELFYSIENAQCYEDLKEIKQEIAPESVQSKKTKENPVNVLKTLINGYTVYIGKNNKQNDYIYSKISSPEDLWFHVLNAPGSHVLIKTEKSMPDDDTLLKTAKLAKQFSSAKDSSKTSVVYTMRKYIKRPVNTKSGFVVFKNEKEIVVE